MIKLKKLFIVLLVLCPLLIGCPETDINNSILARIDITNAANLFIASASSGRSARNIDNNKLFKITEDGYIQEVSFFDETGKAMTNIETPTAIYNAADDYVIISFRNDAYLTRKSDGAVFVVPVPNSSSQGSNFKNAKKIQTDKYGNIYYQPYSSQRTAGILKLDISNPNAIIQTDYLPSGDVGEIRFAVNPDGHIIYNLPSNIIKRIKKSNGGIYNIADNNFFIGLDGVIRSWNWNYITSYNIDSEFNLSANSVLVEGSFSNIDMPLMMVFMYNSYILYFSNNILIASENQRDVWEIEGQNLREITLPIKTKKVDYSSSCYYISGNDPANAQPSLIKVNPITDEIQYIFAPNLYDVYDFNVSDNDVISFTALRMNDGAKVIGNISSSGEVTILSTEFNAEGIVLERIR